MREEDGVAELELAVKELKARVIGHTVEVHRQVGSTNTLLVQRAREGAPEGLVLLADEQELGRGRQGRTWSSPAGTSVLCSVLLRPTWLSPERAFYLTLMAALAAAEGIQQASGLALSLKWPNDLQLGPRKLGGLLVEAECRREGVVWAVIGCGINVNWDPTSIPELRERATSIQRELGARLERGVVVKALLEALDRRYHDLRQASYAPLMAAWRARLITIGQRVRVEEQGQTINGTALDVEEDGALVVRDDLGFLHRVLSASGLTWLD